MIRIFKHLIAVGLVSVSLTACAGAPKSQTVALDDLPMFGAMPKDIDQRLQNASAHPLGHKENPVRVYMPEGEYAYLERLRCQNGTMPAFERIGNFGIGPFGHIIDGYDVKCPGSEPAQSTIFMDMYFPEYIETKAPPGFTLAAD